jgi:hypothetical protein
LAISLTCIRFSQIINNNLKVIKSLEALNYKMPLSFTSLGVLGLSETDPKWHNPIDSRSFNLLISSSIVEGNKLIIDGIPSHPLSEGYSVVFQNDLQTFAIIKNQENNEFFRWNYINKNMQELSYFPNLATTPTIYQKCRYLTRDGQTLICIEDSDKRELKIGESNSFYYKLNIYNLNNSQKNFHFKYVSKNYQVTKNFIFGSCEELDCKVPSKNSDCRVLINKNTGKHFVVKGDKLVGHFGDDLFLINSLFNRNNNKHNPKKVVIRNYDTKQGDLLRKFACNRVDVHSVILSPDKKYLIALTTSNVNEVSQDNILIFSMETRKEISTFNYEFKTSYNNSPLSKRLHLLGNGDVLLHQHNGEVFLSPHNILGGRKNTNLAGEIGLFKFPKANHEENNNTNANKLEKTNTSQNSI